MFVMSTGHVRLGCTSWGLGMAGFTRHCIGVDATVEVTGVVTGDCIGTVAVITIISTAGGMGDAISGSECSWWDGMTIAAGYG